MIIAIGNRIGKVLGNTWTPASIDVKLLYWGSISEITGGVMPNKVAGATDHLDIGGSAGSYTFQCPDTAPYIAADTDYIWFKTDETPRVTTEAELIGYDLPRTPVKYDNLSDYSIREVIILKSGEVLTSGEEDKLHEYMELAIYWSGIWNDYGYDKENRPLQQQYLWTPEIVDVPTSYDNTGGKGDRAALIAVTKSDGLIITPGGYSPVHPALIDGHLTDDWTTFCQFNSGSCVNEWINFDFKAGARKIIDEIKFYTNPSYTQGVWQLKGSNEESATPSAGSFANIGTPFTLTNGLNTAMSSNNTGYRHYRIVGTSGGVTSNGLWWEFEFKINA